MRRRTFVAGLGSAAAWSVVGRAQEPKVWRLGWLTPASNQIKTERALFDACRQEMNTLGYVEGQNLAIEVRQAEGHFDRLPDMAANLVSLRCNAIVAIATPAIAAAQRATSTIPIIMCPSTDPIGSGFIKSFAHPGANITGLANMFGDLTAKTLEILHAIVPDAKRIAVLTSTNPTHPPIYEISRAAGQALGLTTVRVVAPTPTELERALQEMANQSCDALFVLADPIRPTIVPLAAKIKIPAIYQFREFVDAGGLVSYGPNLMMMFRKAAQYVDSVFKGANPAEIPVEQPTTFELVINLGTAKSLGLQISDNFLLRVDEVIE